MIDFFKKKYMIRKDGKRGWNVYYKNWWWPFWIFFDQASTKKDGEEWIANDRIPPEYY